MALCPIQTYEKEESRVSEELVTEIGGGIETGQSYSSNIRTPRTVTKGSPTQTHEKDGEDHQHHKQVVYGGYSPPMVGGNKGGRCSRLFVRVVVIPEADTVLPGVRATTAAIPSGA